LLQSQLLSQVTNTPLQPQLSESNLFLISAGGPGSASFNEFNPLFNRDGHSVLLSALGGQRETRGGEAIASGIAGKAAYSVGYTKFRSDGFRINNDQDDAMANAFIQYDLSPESSLQAEYRYRKTDIGDLQQKFFAEDVFAGLRNTQELNTLRLGSRHAFAPNSMVLGSLTYQDAKFGTIFDEPGFFTGLEIPQNSVGLELQHLYRSPRVNVRSGLGVFKISGDINSTLRIDLPPPPVGPGGTQEEVTRTSTDIRHLNGYAYADFKAADNLVVTGGLSYDSLTGDQDKNQLNPKLGVVWSVTPRTTVRAAVFKVLKRTLITNQTLEPTQVAGFNQFFDDGNLAESKRYGAAVDQKFSGSLFGGVEYSKRDLDVLYLDAFTDPQNPSFKTVDWEEQLGRAYLFWTPHPWVALRAEYIYEKFERDEVFAGGVKSLDSQRLPLGANFFHPSGLTASVTATFWRQKGEFERFPVFESGKDDFWVTDLALGYRLPNRQGMITVGVTNLFDRQFNFYEIDPSNSTIQPKRMVFLRVSLALP
jgi:hypothetical protein